MTGRTMTMKGKSMTGRGEVRGVGGCGGLRVFEAEVFEFVCVDVAVVLVGEPESGGGDLVLDERALPCIGMVAL